MMKGLRLLLPISLLFGPLAAQLTPEEPPPKRIRFLALGGLPEWQGALPLAGGAPARAIPPSPVSIRSGDSWNAFQLPLLAYTRVIPVADTTPGLILRKDQLENDPPQWVTAKLPAFPLSLGVLYRRPRALDWSNPKLLLLNDDPAAFPTGSARFVNVSELPMLVQIGDPTLRPVPKVFTVPVGKAIQKPLGEDETPIRIGYLDPQRNPVWVWSQEALLQKNDRLQAFGYPSPEVDPRPPMTLHVTLQPPPLTPGGP